ncbi:hypothetical protein EYF80_009935 [Liparis tanakae]|uniref:Uncharacterized protein n=1 Tax=Liparis tanakae TaxID=230148 RepID=A0A4Z2IQE3_9TELE|nr:hypothetical protein EYF80_009935 [Liparis tanakae]
MRKSLSSLDQRCSISSNVSLWYSCSRAFTFCWQSVSESLSLSSSPFMLALFTIWTRIGVNSPSRARRP